MKRRTPIQTTKSLQWYEWTQDMVHWLAGSAVKWLVQWYTDSLVHWFTSPLQIFSINVLDEHMFVCVQRERTKWRECVNMHLDIHIHFYVYAWIRQWKPSLQTRRLRRLTSPPLRPLHYQQVPNWTHLVAFVSESGVTTLGNSLFFSQTTFLLSLPPPTPCKFFTQQQLYRATRVQNMLFWTADGHSGAAKKSHF